MCVHIVMVMHRMLGARVADLEHRLKVLEISGLWSSSSTSSSSGGPVLDLVWNEDANDGGGELMIPHRAIHIPSSSSSSHPNSSGTHQSSPPLSSQIKELTLINPLHPHSSTSSSSTTHHPQPTMEDEEKTCKPQPETVEERETNDSTSVDSTPVVLA